MFSFRTILSASILFATLLGSLSGDKPADGVKFNIFDSKLHSFETNLPQHISNFEATLKNGNDKEDALLQPIKDALANIANMLDDNNKDNWRAAFLKATAKADGSPNSIAVNYVTEAKQRIGALQSDFSDFNENKQQLASNILSKLDNSLIQFNQKSSFFLQNALISSPLLIELALVIALFHPISKGLGIDDDVKHHRLPCSAYDTLFEYREYAVDSRLDKLKVMLVRDGEKHKVGAEDMKDIATQSAEFTFFAKKFDPSTSLVDLAKIIRDVYSDEHKRYRDEQKISSCGDPKEDLLPILKAIVDDFGADKEKMWKMRDGCAEEYATIVKERTEKMFPVSLFKEFCDEAQGNPTGNGYLTLKIKRVQAHSSIDGTDCDEIFMVNIWSKGSVHCDPFIKLYVGGKNVWTSKVENNNELIEPNYTYRSVDPIPKDTKIKIEVWDDESVGEPQLIQDAEGTVTEFLNKRNWAGIIVGLFQNSIETFVMWKDVYQK